MFHPTHTYLSCFHVTVTLGAYKAAIKVDSLRIYEHLAIMVEISCVSAYRVMLASVISPLHDV